MHKPHIRNRPNSKFQIPQSSSINPSLSAASMASAQSDPHHQLHEIFRRFDTDSDGSLTQLELGALLRSLGIKPSGDQLHSLLSHMDANGNGSIEFDELVGAILPVLTDDILVNQDQLVEIFRSFDRDGNGFITAAEFAGCMAKMGQPLTYNELSEMMRKADTDGDGVISFNEFTSAMAKSAAEFLGLAFA